ncbi:hypothetical protein, partial [Desulfosarcina sp.]|uniref:hypothetical protein n=1 Tax=Desulfosarcina sp. TaxID=2027861 RepID=UPI003561FCAE
QLEDLRRSLPAGRQLRLINKTLNESYTLVHSLSGRQLRMVMAGGLINSIRLNSARSDAGGKGP